MSLLLTCIHPTAPSLSPVPASQAQAHKSSSCTSGPNEAVPILQCVRSRLNLPEIKRELADQPPCLCLPTSLPSAFPSPSFLPVLRFQLIQLSAPYKLMNNIKLVENVKVPGGHKATQDGRQYGQPWKPEEQKSKMCKVWIEQFVLYVRRTISKKVWTKRRLQQLVGASDCLIAKCTIMKKVMLSMPLDRRVLQPQRIHKKHTVRKFHLFGFCNTMRWVDDVFKFWWNFQKCIRGPVIYTQPMPLKIQDKPILSGDIIRMICAPNFERLCEDSLLWEFMEWYYLCDILWICLWVHSLRNIVRPRWFGNSILQFYNTRFRGYLLSLDF